MTQKTFASLVLALFTVSAAQPSIVRASDIPAVDHLTKCEDGDGWTGAFHDLVSEMLDDRGEVYGSDEKGEMIRIIAPFQVKSLQYRDMGQDREPRLCAEFEKIPGDTAPVRTEIRMAKDPVNSFCANIGFDRDLSGLAILQEIHFSTYGMNVRGDTSYAAKGGEEIWVMDVNTGAVREDVAQPGDLLLRNIDPHQFTVEDHMTDGAMPFPAVCVRSP